MKFAAIVCLIVGSLLPVAEAAPRVVRVSVDGVVHPITVEIVRDALSQAREQQASAILLRLNTPGGLLEAARKIIEEIDVSPVPVVAYVEPSGGRAASAGFLLLQAGDFAAMAPGTHTGAASPVLIGQTMDPVMRAKVENDTAALLRGLTSHHGRNSEMAEKAIRDAKAFTDKEALDNNLIDLIAESESELFKKLDGRQITRFNGTKRVLHLAGAEIVDCKLSLREKLIETIADPNIGFILLVLGALGLYVEFSSPGLIAPGVAGALLLLLALSSLSVLPINWVGAALLVLAITLFVLEAKVISHGVLGSGGVIAMVLGAVILINGPPELRIHLSTALGVALPFAFITLFLVSLVVKARKSRVLTGLASMLGEVGVAQTMLAPAGQVFIRGEIWNAISLAHIGQGVPVRVTGVDGLTLRVEPANPPQSPKSSGAISKGESKT